MAALLMATQVLFGGFFITNEDISSSMQWMFDATYLKHSLDGIGSLVFGFNRTKLDCHEMYCHFESPKKFMEFIGLREDLSKTFTAIISTLVIIHIATFCTLRYRLRNWGCNLIVINEQNEMLIRQTALPAWSISREMKIESPEWVIHSRSSPDDVSMRRLAEKVNSLWKLAFELWRKFSVVKFYIDPINRRCKISLWRLSNICSAVNGEFMRSAEVVQAVNSDC